MDAKEILDRTESRMTRTVEDMKTKLATVRTGRASLGILDGVRIDYYGTPTPVNQIAKLSIPEPSMILAQPFDLSMLSAVEKAIRVADLGLNPGNDGKLIRIPVPPLTEERRKQLVRKVRGMGEDGKTAVRQVRRDGNEEIKRMKKDGEISEDDERRQLDVIQKKTDKHTGEIDGLCDRKEAELMEI